MTLQVRSRYERYVAAFNAHDLRELEDYLAPDLVFDWGEIMPPLIGRAAFLDFYRTAWEHFDETIQARVVSSTEQALTAWIDTELVIRRDWLDCPIRPYRAGEVHRVSGEVAYRLRDGMIVHIV